MHWKSFSRYFSQTTSRALIAVFAVLTVASLLIPNNGPQRGGPPNGFGGAAGGQATQVLLQASLANLATVTQQAPETLVDELESQGIAVTDTQQSVEQLARANQRNPVEVLNNILK